MLDINSRSTHLHMINVEVLADFGVYPDFDKYAVIGTDNCLIEPYRREFIARVGYIIDYIIRQAQTSQPSCIILKSFSATQAHPHDYFGAVEELSYLSAPSFHTLASEIEQRLLELRSPDIQVIFEEESIIDVLNDPRSVLSFQDTKSKVSAFLAENKDSKPNAESQKTLMNFTSNLFAAYKVRQISENKKSLPYYSCHRTLERYNPSRLDLFCYDDQDAKILQPLQQHYSSRAQSLSANTTLTLHHCRLDNGPEILKIYPTIQGTGSFNPEYKQKLYMLIKERMVAVADFKPTDVTPVAASERPAVASPSSWLYIDNSTKHPIQGLIAQISLLPCTYFLLLHMIKAPLSAGIIAVTINILISPFGVPVGAALTDKIAASRKSRNAALFVSSVLTSVPILMQIFSLPAYAVLPITAVVGYLVTIPTASAWINYLWKEKSVGAYIKSKLCGKESRVQPMTAPGVPLSSLTHVVTHRMGSTSPETKVTFRLPGIPEEPSCASALSTYGVMAAARDRAEPPPSLLTIPTVAASRS